ncbi:MAG: iron-sulfur cluster carrier protein ApbC [Gammaproteobacteria bacterium]|nr:iron-sulfur cluster carrier protein ApbC [Gammaproteobacteria bacterium]
MPEPTPATIEARLRGFTEPYLGTDLVGARAIKRIDTDGAEILVEVELGFPTGTYGAELAGHLRELLAPAAAGRPVRVDVATRIVGHEVQRGAHRLANVRNIVAVASGKGGVGKSTTAVNLAVALQRDGARTGLLDADIYGPSQPRMLGCGGRPDSKDGKTMEPMVSYGVQAMSIGNLVDEETPMIWRGPMATSALTQLLNDTRWDDLDYLVVDLPPGTGDIQLTLCQNIPVTGAVIVTTPQDIALLDARKALKMFEKVNVPVLGIIENMSIHVCSKCGHEEPIFGAGGGEAMAAQYGVDLLGALPLDIRIREGADNGRPTVAVEPESAAAHTYVNIARRIAAKISLRGKDYSARFPKIVVENS